jgi:hypothetical protein
MILLEVTHACRETLNEFSFNRRILRVFAPALRSIMFLSWSERPEAATEEVPGIITSQALPLGAHALWLQPPNTADEARRMAAEYGLAYVEGIDIAQVARAVRRVKR